MAEMRLKTNNTFSTVITVRESDQYSKQVYLKLEADVPDVGLRSCTEHFMNHEELFELGSFLVAQSSKIKHRQEKAK